MNNKLSILIPTCNRAETLHWAIKSCLKQDYDNLEVIISDNFSSDETLAIVKSFTDSRLKYHNTGKRVSMSHNWEFALSKVDSGFVSILGDDDAFLPGSIKEINDFINRYQVEAITWKQSFYRWPSNKFAKIGNVLAIPRGRKSHIRDGENALSSLLEYRLMVDEVPWLYGGFVDYSLINKIKKRGNGFFFNSRIPDIYSAVVLSSLTKKYLYCSRPLSIAGHSGKSNGSAHMNPKVDESITRLFAAEAININFHNKVEFIHTHAFLLWESFLQAKEVGLISDEEQKGFNNWKLFKMGIKECARLGVLDAERIKIFSVANKNGFDLEEVERVYCKHYRHNGSKRKKLLSSFKFWTTKIIIDGSKSGINNVYEASLAQREMDGNCNMFYLLNNIRILISKLNEIKHQIK